jgi:hypothetical protein
VGRLNRDRVPDLVISHDGAVEFFRTTRSGIQRVFARTPGDAHGCAVADVNRDGLGDVCCTRGAHRGTITEANRLWIQTSPGIFQDRAARYGVEDRSGAAVTQRSSRSTTIVVPICSSGTVRGAGTGGAHRTGRS